MCGIVAYSGPGPVAPILLAGLRALEYRGYDSAGIALGYATPGTPPAIVRRAGKLDALAEAVAAVDGSGAICGIAHTRWATHGRPTDANAHPHASCGGEAIVVHNGIVENYAQLRAELVARGHRFRSETDTETVAHLVEEGLRERLPLLDAVRLATARLEGSQAIVVMSPAEPGVLVAARIGNAGGIVVGHGTGELFLASDLAAVLPHTHKVSFLADGELVRADGSAATFVTRDGRPFEPHIREIPFDPERAARGDHETFMLKEILEQPEALADTIGSLVIVEPPELQLPDFDFDDRRLREVDRVVLIAMGTSLHAAMVGRHYVEKLARVPAEVENASEFRYREPLIDAGTLVISVSQSGETVDLLEAMEVARARGALQVTICNTLGAQTTRVADGTVYTRAGLERGVASTKTFVTSVVALYVLALKLAMAQGRLDRAGLGRHLQRLIRVPDAVARLVADLAAYERAASRFVDAKGLLCLGRGLALPLAMEAALKLKEISYLHAEGYPAGEMKHGPIALIDESFPTIAVATQHALRTKMTSNIEQIRARGGYVLAVATEGDPEIAAIANDVVYVPDVPAEFEPVVGAVPLQCIAYFVARARGCDIDQPRNLAKTVTVE